MDGYKALINLKYPNDGFVTVSGFTTKAEMLIAIEKILTKFYGNNWKHEANIRQYHSRKFHPNGLCMAYYEYEVPKKD